MPWRGKGYRTLVWQSNGPDTMGAFGGVHRLRCISINIVSGANLVLLDGI